MARVVGIVLVTQLHEERGTIVPRLELVPTGRIDPEREAAIDALPQDAGDERPIRRRRFFTLEHRGHRDELVERALVPTHLRLQRCEDARREQVELLLHEHVRVDAALRQQIRLGVEVALEDPIGEREGRGVPDAR